MQPLTQQGLQRINELANQYGVSTDGVLSLLQALINGNGTMAQFSHPDFGGSGQWMQGGMTMVSDLFNHSLKSKVDNLCYELSNLLASQPFRPVANSFQSQSQGNGQQQQGGNYSSNISLFVPGSNPNWWPSELGFPSSVGAQNNVRYAFFPTTQRLAIDINGELTIYDTLNHQIGGVSQQQGFNGSITFTSQFGTVAVSSLPNLTQNKNPSNDSLFEAATPNSNQNSALENDIFSKIEKLAELRQKGILTEEEFSSKKAELLARL